MIKNEHWVELPVEKLKHAPWNYKDSDGSEDIQAALNENIKRNSQVENIIVREIEGGFFEVCNGNHRLTSFQTLGIKEAVCYNLGQVSEAEAVRLTIETNETKFPTNQIKLAERIRQISAEFSAEDLVKTMPYSEKEMENFKRLNEFTWDAPVPAPTKGRGYSENIAPQTGEKRTLSLSIDSQVADDFEHLLKRIKAKLYPEDEHFHVSNTEPIQFIIEKVLPHL